MKILTADEIKAADLATFTKTGIPPRVVMENAGRAVVSVLLAKFPTALSKNITICTGSGNNGGDGFVIARVLKNIGAQVTVLASKTPSELKAEAKENAELWLKSGGVVLDLNQVEEKESLELLKNSGLIIDALYGTGFSGALSGKVKALVRNINESAAKNNLKILAVDIPSGVEAQTGKVEGESIKADLTVALQTLKVGHLLLPGGNFCGEIIVADIGLDNSLPEIKNIQRELINESLVSDILKSKLPTKSSAHKGDKGHLLVIGGSAGHFGAPKMAALSALSTGAGLVTLALPESAAKAASAESLELMCASLAEDLQGNFLGSDTEILTSIIKGKDVIVIGPGMGQGEGAKKILNLVLTLTKNTPTKLVLDADALNLISNGGIAYQEFSEDVVFTPHPGEMARLLKLTSEKVQNSRLQVAVDAAAKFKSIVVLKGARSIIANPRGEVLINPAATETLATAGSGDVLAGVIGALLGRGFSGREAAICGVFVHGATGERLESIGTIAGDIIKELPQVMREVIALKEKNKALTEKVLPGSLIPSDNS